MKKIPHPFVPACRALFIFVVFSLTAYAQATQKIIDLDFKFRDSLYPVADALNSEISENGRYVVYADVLTVGGLAQIYRHDRSTGNVSLISKNTAGEAGDHNSYTPSISANGRYVVFSSSAHNLIDTDSNPYINDEADGRDVYLHDTRTGVTELISRNSQGIQGNHMSGRPKISDDGQRIVYLSQADNLIANDAIFDVPLSGHPFLFQRGIPGGIVNLIDAFMFDRITGETTLISRNSNGDQADFHTSAVAVSGDGKTVVLTSGAQNIARVPDITAHVFVKDIASGKTQLVSRAADGTVGEDNSGSGPRGISISKHGNYIVYLTYSTNIVAPHVGEDDNRVLVVYDRVRDISILANQNYQNKPLGDVSSVDISDDGRYVAFSTITNSGSVLEQPLAFIYDRDTGNLAKADNQGIRQLGIRSAISISITGNGDEVIFVSSHYLTVQDEMLNSIFSFKNSLFENKGGLTLEKTINTDSSDPATGEVILLMANGRLYRADYKATNTTSDKRMYQIVINDNINGERVIACTIPGLLPGQTKHCRAHYPVEKGFHTVPAQATAMVTGSKTPITADSPAAYQGYSVRTGKLTVNQSLNNHPGDRQRDAVSVNSSATQQWLYKVENTTNVNLYKVKVYLDGQSPENTPWEQQCYLGRLNPGEVRYCKRERMLGVPGLNLAQGWVQGVDAMPLHGKYEPVTNVNRTWYQIAP